MYTLIGTVGTTLALLDVDRDDGVNVVECMHGTSSNNFHLMHHAIAF